MSFIDDIIMRLIGMEQSAVFSLYNEGVRFDEMRLYRRLNGTGSEQGILVRGRVAYTLTYRTYDVPIIGIVGAPSPIIIDIVGKFHPPFEYLN